MTTRAQRVFRYAVPPPPWGPAHVDTDALAQRVAELVVHRTPEFVGQLPAPDPARLVCGLATTFGERAGDGRWWDGPAFRGFLELRVAVRLMVEHAPAVEPETPVVTQTGWAPRVTVRRPVAATGWSPAAAGPRLLDAAGWAVRFEEVDTGLAVLAAVDEGRLGDGLLGLASGVSRGGWGFSVAAQVIDGPGGRVTEAVPLEVSLTGRPAYPGAVLYAGGAATLAEWEVLTRLARPRAVRRSRG